MKKPIGYELASDDDMNLLYEIWAKQGKIIINCTGMASLSFLDTKTTFWASKDCVVPANEYALG